MVHDSLEGPEFVGGLPRIQRAQRFQDTRSQRLRRKLGAHHQILPIGLCLGCRHIDLGTGRLFHAALANIGNDANNPRIGTAYALGQVSHGVLAWPVTAGRGLIDDDHRARWWAYLAS